MTTDTEDSTTTAAAVGAATPGRGTAARDVVRVELPALPAHVRTARLITTAVARRAGLPDGHVDEFRLAVGEACARAVDLHARFAPLVPVEVVLSWTGGTLTVGVADRGPEPAGAALPEAGDLMDSLVARDPPDPDLGLALVRGLVDDVTVAPREGGGTTVTLRWPLAADADAGLGR